MQLRSIAKHLNLRLVSRSALFGLSALLLTLGSWWWALFFVIVSLFLYNPFDGVEGFSFFIVLDALVVTFGKFLVTPAAFLAFFAISAGLFFIILGIKHVAFYNILSPALLLSAAFSYGLFLAWMLDVRGTLFFLIFFAILTFGYLRIALQHTLRERTLLGWILVFLTFEFMIVIQALPIGFLNAGVVILVFLLVMLDYAFHALRHSLTRRRVFNELACGASACALVLLNSIWLPF